MKYMLKCFLGLFKLSREQQSKYLYMYILECVCMYGCIYADVCMYVYMYVCTGSCINFCSRVTEISGTPMTSCDKSFKR